MQSLVMILGVNPVKHVTSELIIKVPMEAHAHQYHSAHRNLTLGNPLGTSLPATREMH